MAEKDTLAHYEKLGPVTYDRASMYTATPVWCQMTEYVALEETHYTGFIDEHDDKPESKGIAVWIENGQIDEGYYIDNNLVNGRSILPSGNVYQGEFSAGKPHGKGTFTFVSGGRYVGDFAGGK